MHVRHLACPLPALVASFGRLELNLTFFKAIIHFTTTTLCLRLED